MLVEFTFRHIIALHAYFKLSQFLPSSEEPNLLEKLYQNNKFQFVQQFPMQVT